MAELIIDTAGREEEAGNLLKEVGIIIEECNPINVFLVPDSAVGKIEEILTANGIEFQWSERFEEDIYYEENQDDPT